jgi:hypothetical protein
MPLSKKMFLLCAISCFAFIIQAQTQASDSGFSGDTLKGFNLQAIYAEANNKHIEARDLSGYIKEKQKEFVIQKYHLLTSHFIHKGISIPQTPTYSCNNLSFETGTFAGWTGAIGYNANSTKALTLSAKGIKTLGINSAQTSCSYHTLVNTGTDQYSGLPMVDPGGGTWAIRLGGEFINVNSTNCTPADSNFTEYYSSGELIQQTFPVTSANALFNYSSMVVLARPTVGGHSPQQCPYFRAELLDSAGNALPCNSYYIATDTTQGGPPPPGLFVSSSVNSQGYTVLYSLWTQHSVNLSAYIGQNVTARFTAAGCELGGHFACAYIDASCSPVQVQVSAQSCSGGTMTVTSPDAGTKGTYSWQTIPSGTAGIVGGTGGQSITINANGTYQVTVQPAFGCMYTIDTTLTFNPSPAITLQSTNPTCTPGNDGSVYANPVGGNTPYTYSWSPFPASGQGTAQITGLGAGTYTCTISTSNGCVVSSTSTLTNPAGLSASTSQTNVMCFGSATGSATATPSGGNGPYFYSWSPGGGTSATASGLSAGTYTVTLSDNGNCTTNSTVNITEPNALTNSFGFQNATCGSCADGSATAVAGGGTRPYTYSWSAAGASTANISNLSAGTYTCCITDANQCAQLCGSVMISFTTGIPTNVLESYYILYPNPFGSSFFVQARLIPDDADLSVYNILGKQIFHQKIHSTITEFSTVDLAVGIYFVRISEADKTACFKMIKN